MNQLRSISLKGWKSIRQCDIELGRLNVLLGANGAGKSSLLAFFRLLGQLIEGRLQTHIQLAGGANSVLHFGAQRTPAIEAAVQFQQNETSSGYAFKLHHGAPDRLIFVEETYGQELGPSSEANRAFQAGGHLESLLPDRAARGDSMAQEICELITGCRMFHFHDTSEHARVRLPASISDNRGLYLDAGNVASMLYLYAQRRPEVCTRIFSAVKQVGPFISDIRLSPQPLDPSRIELIWRQQGEEKYDFQAHQLSDGTLRMIALATLLLQPEESLPLLIVLDEPELGLHPAAIGVLASMLHHASHHCQILLATQSVTLADHFDPADVIVVEQRDNASTFRRLEPEVFREWLDEYTVGQLWEKNVIGGGPY